MCWGVSGSFVSTALSAGEEHPLRREAMRFGEITKSPLISADSVMNALHLLIEFLREVEGLPGVFNPVTVFRLNPL